MKQFLSQVWDNLRSIGTIVGVFGAAMLIQYLIVSICAAR